MESLRHLLSRILAYTVTSITVLMLVFGADAPIVFAQPRLGPGGGAGPAAPVAISVNLPEQVNSTYENIYTELTRAGLIAFFNALQIFFGQLAYDAATYIATGGKGQEAVFYKKGFGEYLKDVGSAAVGEFVGDLSNSQFFQNMGLNLCRPSNPAVMLRLQLSLGAIGQQSFPQAPNLGLGGAYRRPRPKCEFQEIVNNYSTLYQTMSNQDILQSVGTSFDSSLSELGSITGIYNRFLGEVNRQVQSASQQRTEGRGFRSIENVISGNIRTPASVVETATSNAVDRYPNERQSVVIGAMLSDAFQQGPIQLASYTASIFLNTLASKFLKRIFEKGLGVTYTNTIFQNTGPDSIAVYGRTDARSANIDLKNPPIQRAASYDVIADMIACPAGQRGLWNCVLDQSFAQAVQTKGDQGGISVREALERKLLRKDWRLIPITQTRENQDPLCYTYAYCAANLQKLRAMRIIPVGFEFAANSQANADRCAGSQGCVTLGEVVDGFSQCNLQGQSDAEHPWCHLIDPNWILTSFPQQCVQTGYSDTLLSEKIGLRKEECSDIQTCLKRNDKGECIGGYGYCMAEKTVYRFKGDECPAAAASCRTYVNAVGQKVSYLRNTVDRSQCSVDNSGCMWYATKRIFPEGRLDVWDANTSTGEKIYFDQTLEGCDESNDGCTQLRVVTPGQSALNLAINGSFERTDGTGSPNMEGWKTNGLRDPVSFIDQSTSTAIFGTRSLKLRSPFSVSQRVSLFANRSYTFSGYARVASREDGVPNLFVNLRPLNERNESFATEVLNRAYHSAACTIDASGGANIGVTLDRNVLSMDWQRFECNFVAVSGTVRGDFTIQGYNVVVDGVQFEEGEYATAFLDGLNTGLPVIHMKLPPQGLTCDVRQANRQATAESDFAACSNFALSCNQADAGCQAYRDLDTDGGEVPAIVSQNDLCPASCVGYAEFRKNPSAFDLVQDADNRFNDPEEATTTYFIPRTAGQCTQADVGCEEFTRVDESGAADGQREYYSYLRACEKPDENTETFFTWEGADTTGYQLRTWSLKRGAAGLGPKSLAKLQPDQLSFKEPASCNEASWRTAADPDCRQFYDARGTIYYRYFSQTVISSSSCVALRMNASNRADCEKTGGNFNTRGECVYQALPTESRVCRAQVAGCRMFLGTGAGNTQTVLSQNFRQSYSQDFPSTGVSLSTSTEALLVGDSSLRVGPNPSDATVAIARARFASDDLAFYRVTFWAKAPAVSTSLTLSTSGQGSSNLVIGSVQLSPDWQRFTVGLFEGAPGVSSTNLIWSAPMPRGGTYGFYLDEVSVTRVQDLVYARNKTWTTPAECDKGIDGAFEAQAMLGCRRYQNRKNETITARRFTRLCREEAIGCTGFIDTRNSESVAAQTFVRGDTPVLPGFGSATTTRLADRYVYLIDDPQKRCDASNASCRAFGRPRFMPDRQTLDPSRPFETMYFKDDITKYEAGLCKPSELFCSEFLYGSNKDYFKDPDTHICEYREARPASGAGGRPAEAGWYVVGGSEPCYPTILEGNAYGLARTGDSTYRGWVGLCQEEHSECTELRDVNDHSDPVYRSGKPYFFVRNEQLDTSSCNGNIDLSKGCVLFRDMSDGFLKYNVKASYAKYQETFAPSAPVNCRETPDDPHCAQVGRCVGTVRTFGRAAGSRVFRPMGSEGRRDYDPVVETQRSSQEWEGGTCTQDSDCAVPQVWGTETFTHLMLDSRGYSVATTTPSQVTRYETRCQIRGAEDSNDSNLIVKVNVDRDCAQWLGCKSSETVRDPVTNQYKDLCTNLALCDKSSGQDGDRFCGNYVERQSTSTEPILSKGAFFNISLYTKRAVGLGEKDYSGYTLPGAFQILDLKSTRVANDGAKNVENAAYRFSQDYRLAAAIPMPAAVRQDSLGSVFRHARRPRLNEAEMLDGTPLAARFPGLYLCRHVGTGRIGYYVNEERRTEREFTCYVPVRGESDIFDFQNVTEKFTLADPSSDPLLKLAYPAAECRSYPEQESPFAASFVADWDTSKNPPKARSKVQGFAAVNTCEFGEDCSCTYKKADYDNALVKYYNAYSSAVPTGICDGGPRSGQTCLPSTIFNPGGGQTGAPATPLTPAQIAAGQQPATPKMQAIEESNAELTCGPPELGGRCLPFKSVSIVRGIFGNCLERDMSRIIGNNQNLHPCLTWNPNPVLLGDKDPYHFDPASGYLPPQNSGQYFCTSDARAPKLIELAASYFDNTGGNYVDRMKKIDFDDSYVSDASGAALDGDDNSGAIDGIGPGDSSNGTRCEDTDDDQHGEDAVNEKDALALRLVTTGRGRPHSYTETFYRLNPTAIANNLNGVGNAQPNQAKAAIAENNFSYIRISPIRSPNGTARLACGYNQEWVDGLNVEDYNELDQVKPADSQWHEKFSAEFKPILTRGTERILTARDGAGNDAALVARTCVPLPGEPTSNKCFFKTWETGYRSEGKGQLFNGINRATTATDDVISFETIRTNPVYDTCNNDKPYFAVRAVFQTSAMPSDQGQPTRYFTDADTSTIRRRLSEIKGPWRLVGFWVSACGGRSAEEQFIYMNVDLNFGDICRELAEVVSRNSHQDAAFTDRVWKNANFIVPGLGIQYNARYAPFSSALNTGPAGEEPLFQTGQEVTGYSRLKPPVFIASGLKTYYEKNADPKDKYAYLSNIFARVYRIYRFYDREVGIRDTACLAGPSKGNTCTPYTTQTATPSGGTTYSGGSASLLRGVAPECSLNGVCDVNRFAAADSSQSNNTYCNSLSGINAGVRCPMNPDLCHLGAIQGSGTGANARLLPCVTQTGWRRVEDGTNRWERLTGSTWGSTTTQEGAADAGAFRCPSWGNSMRREGVGVYDQPEGGNIGHKCSSPTDQGEGDATGSRECPERILNNAAVGPAIATPAGRPPDTSNRIFSACVRADGSTPVALGEQGRCRVNVPSLNIVLPNGKNFSLGSFEVRPDNENYPSCHGHFDCSFTQMNYYYTPPRSPAGLEPSYYSARSYRSMSPDGNSAGFCNDHSNPVCKSKTVQGQGTDRPWLTLVSGGGMRGARNYGQGDHEIAIHPEEWTRYPGVESQMVNAGGDDNPEYVMTIGSCIAASVQTGVQQGICTGGLFDGRVCDFPDRGTGRTCIAANYNDPSGRERERRENVCGQPVVSGRNVAECQVDPLSTLPAQTNYTPATNLNEDNNTCTHEEGYVPKSSLCPDPRDEFCGLMAYNIKAGEASFGRTSVAPLPTDVTQGLYTPIYLANTIGITPRIADESYAAYYKPHPPMIAAPNLRNCASPGQCEVLGVNKVTFNGQTEGIVNVGGSQNKATLAFYAWADHEQMPLRSLYIDWGDGSIQKLPDARLRNHKPFCGVLKECVNPTNMDLSTASGLTCNTDSDCPAGAGVCRPVGTCKDSPGIRCSNDSQCRVGGGTDVCQYRTMFGNSPEACESNYFQFSHSYTCQRELLPSCRATVGRSTIRPPASMGPNTCFFGTWEGLAAEVMGGESARPTCTAGTGGLAQCNAWLAARGLSSDDETGRGGASRAGVTCVGSAPDPSTTFTGRCERDPARVCQNATQCAVGDRCMENLAPPSDPVSGTGGCWDDQAQTCKFTPRVLIQDNWGWCTGECRNQSDGGGGLRDDLTQLTSAAPRALHPYGGCYAGTPAGTEKSIRSNSLPRIFDNECSVLNPKFNEDDPSPNVMRPWIVYPGSINLRGR